MGPRADLDGRGKFSSPLGFAPRTVQPVATELSRPLFYRFKSIKQITKQFHSVDPSTLCTFLPYAHAVDKYMITLSYSIHSATCFG